MRYHQLTREERYQIKVLLKTGQNQSAIAGAIGVNKPTEQLAFFWRVAKNLFPPALGMIQPTIPLKRRLCSGKIASTAGLLSRAWMISASTSR